MNLREFLETVEENSEEQKERCEQSIEMVRLARIGSRVEGMLPPGAEMKDCATLLFGPKAKKQMERIQAKLEGDVPEAKVVTAALKHLEWKMDREAEGLRVFAGHPEQAPDDGDEDEPWKASG